MTIDRLFNDINDSVDFTFNDKVAEVFDDMLERSVPCYRQVIDMTGKLLDPFVQDGDVIYDLGCSTGRPLLALAEMLKAKKMSYIGLDSSEAMINKARLKAEMFSRQEQVSFELADITTAHLEPCRAVLLSYTLQFLRPMQRTAFLKKIFQALKPGGILILSEKIISHHSSLNRSFIDIYLDFKRRQGYSEIEITKKREALENILIPFSIEENLNQLKEAGFTGCESFFQWFNFVSFAAVKE
ncbi:MAG: carboxy-S-adenosyl-L-methionine synthase CmoA [Thermodesulfobacteriota bacterium]